MRPKVVRHLYVHIPFCHHICPYCAFHKHKPGALANEQFVESILTEARCRRKEIDAQFDLESIYFGGGTPSLLSGNLLRKLCRGLVRIFPTDSLVEWTIESNPATFGLDKAKHMVESGINRASLGVQSFNPETLLTLGRDHSSEDAVRAFQDLRTAGFDTISIDLMFSVPGQSLEKWEQDIASAIALDPDHISCYNLTYEEDTEFLKRHEKGELDACEDRDASFFYKAIDLLEAAGYSQYEISNYAKRGSESFHNQAYWNGADYIGLGPGAVSTIGNKRWKTLPDTAKWVAHFQEDRKADELYSEIESLDVAKKQMESIAMQIRTRQGFPKSVLQENEAIVAVSNLIAEGFLAENEAGTHYLLTHKGKALADPIAAMLV